jgi:dCMP deaminase
MKRPNWNEYFLQIAKAVSSRSTCLRRKVGAVLVKDRQLLCAGYNGAPAGMQHCDEIGCEREERDIDHGKRYDICRGVHAEQNVIFAAAKYGVQVDGSTIYCTNFPCRICAKMMVNAGIEKIVYIDEQGYMHLSDPKC